MSQLKYLVLFIAAVLGLGLLIGYLNVPGAWYAGLSKPWFSPPNWIFAPVWTALYVMIAVAGWRVWVVAPDSGLKALWSVQMLLNFAWSPAFFGAQMPWLGLGVILPLLVVILLFIAQGWRRERISALLFLPYAVWVGFASLLNGAIVALN